jgi:hypothetical protein
VLQVAVCDNPNCVTFTRGDGTTLVRQTVQNFHTLRDTVRLAQQIAVYLNGEQSFRRGSEIRAQLLFQNRQKAVSTKIRSTCGNAG